MSVDGRRIRTALAHGTPLDWVFTGDSIVAAVHWTGVERGYVELFTEWLRYTSARRADVVINTAVSGWRIPALRAALDHAVLRFSPDVVVIGLGTNDAREGAVGLADFRRDYGAVIQRIHEQGGAVVLQTPPGVSSSAVQAPSIAAYAAAVRALAAEHGCLLVDHHATWTAPTARLDEWLADPIHPGGAGHRVLADTLIDTLRSGGPSGADQAADSAPSGR
ncbi:MULTISPECIES: SGNH/GDSL hydrolase family protein [Actinoalloteichus]|uniref:Lysophospholipase L1-like esterase n=1 Tax=Actinoalloteichus fjordicus TaxID=1612552 RepID=A0AAC9LEF7_9PSEU|nr:MULTISPECIES: SGNH/GDSL hydrolase family protein [Actinoalloteichus]APU16443.1 lysophospholipase L1-like esterase [Actinoalloteichus fjordicus]APU22502.1 lysophospholipase L1-like esterase [Actinoalloteichus sp. GBA129-24]